jgi:hypothetical protein
MTFLYLFGFLFGVVSVLHTAAALTSEQEVSPDIRYLVGAIYMVAAIGLFALAAMREERRP